MQEVDGRGEQGTGVGRADLGVVERDKSRGGKRKVTHGKNQ